MCTFDYFPQLFGKKKNFRHLVMFFKARLPMLLYTVKMHSMNVMCILPYRATWHWNICALHLENAVNNFVVKIIWSFFFCQLQLRLLFQFNHAIGVPERNLLSTLSRPFVNAVCVDKDFILTSALSKTYRVSANETHC